MRCAISIYVLLTFFHFMFYLMADFRHRSMERSATGNSQTSWSMVSATSCRTKQQNRRRQRSAAFHRQQWATNLLCCHNWTKPVSWVLHCREASTCVAVSTHPGTRRWRAAILIQLLVNTRSPGSWTSWGICIDRYKRTTHCFIC